MTNPSQDVRDILHDIVNDLEKTSAGLAYLSKELRAVIPSSMAGQIDSFHLANAEIRESYAPLRLKIDALQTETP